jgi:tRNA threonylcarbamoyladenosine biosynthesis protein TsaB
VIVLGIETATELVGVSVVGDEGPLASSWVRGGRRHAETLAPLVSQVLGLADLGLADLTGVGVDIGPGLFTGLRVGVATAKGLAEGLGVGLVGVGSLRALGTAACRAGYAGTVTAVIDARRSEVFVARYRSTAGGVEELEGPRVVAPEQLARDLAARSDRLPTLVVGDGALRYAATLGAVHGVTVGDAAFAAPPADVVASLAAARFAQAVAGGEPLPVVDAVVPDYLRGPDARINWQQRSGGAAGPAAQLDVRGRR